MTNRETPSLSPVMDKRKAELAEWVKQYAEELNSWAFRKTSDKPLAEDLVQATFLAALEKWESFKRESHPRTWLYGILKNKITNHYRKLLNNPQTSQIPADDLSGFFDQKGQWKEGARPQDWDAPTEHLLDDPGFKQVMTGCKMTGLKSKTYFSLAPNQTFNQ